MKNSEVGIVNGEMKNPGECWSAGAMGRWSNLTTLHPVRRNGCRILEQKQTKETKRESRFEIGTSLSSFASVQNPSQSSLIKANQAISCLDAIQSQPPSCSKIATSPPSGAHLGNQTKLAAEVSGLSPFNILYSLAVKPRQTQLAAP
jgi:hypothetical protein